MSLSPAAQALTHALQSAAPGIDRRRPATEDMARTLGLSDDQRQRLANDKRVVDDLEQMVKASRADRKSAAAERVNRIRQELDLLKQFASADPKGAARRAAQLARELASAAKEYGSATASQGEASAQSGAQAGPAPANEQAATVAKTAGAGTMAAQSTAPDATPSDPAAGGKAKEPGQAVPGQAVPGQAAKNGDERKALISPESEKAFSEARGDTEFAATVRNLGAQLRAIIERGIQVARREKQDAEAEELSRESRKARTDIEDALQAIEMQATTTMSSAMSSMLSSTEIAAVVVLPATMPATPSPAAQP